MDYKIALTTAPPPVTDISGGTTYTENYKLSQFGNDSHPMWRRDYNSDMRKIDAGIADAKASATSAESSAETATSDVDEMRAQLQEAQADIVSLQNGETATTNKFNTVNTRLYNLEANATVDFAELLESITAGTEETVGDTTYYTATTTKSGFVYVGTQNNQCSVMADNSLINVGKSNSADTVIYHPLGVVNSGLKIYYNTNSVNIIVFGAAKFIQPASAVGGDTE